MSIGDNLRRILRPVEDPMLVQTVKTENDPSMQRMHVMITDSSTYDGTSTEFQIFLGTLKDFSGNIKSDRFVDRLLARLSDVDKRSRPIKPVPEVWDTDLNRVYNAETERYVLEHLYRSKNIGKIEYKFMNLEKDRIATVYDYYPRDHLPNRVASGFPFFLELMTTDHLKDRKGVTHISTSYDPSPSRKEQLDYAGLPSGVILPIDDWRFGLIRGMEKRIEAKKNKNKVT